MPEITYTNIPGVAKPVSRIFFGTGGNDFLNGKNQNDLLDSIFALGINSFAMKSFHSEENFERLHRCEILAEKKHATVSQIALSWIFHQGLNLLSVVSTSSAARMQTNIDALNLDLTEDECLYLNLEA